MDTDDFMKLLMRRMETGKAIFNVRDLPVSLLHQITHMSLAAGFLGERGDIEFVTQVNEDDDLCWVEWRRGDETRTINLIADGSWFSIYLSPFTRNVVRIEGDTYKSVDTETMEAIMLIAGVHPTQL